MTSTADTTALARDGERLDRLARRLYGTERGGTTEALLAANPGLADVALAIPEGRRIVAPEAPAAATTAPVLRPWE